MSEILTGGLFMFIFKETSRNAYNNDRLEVNFRKNFYKYFKINLPHADAVDDVLREIPPDQLETLKAHQVSGLIEQKVFRKFRFLVTYHLVAVDGTGIATFNDKHCEHCLSKTSKNGVATYFHYVLEAKLVTFSGLCISLASEFIENPSGIDYEKQDCEQKAFVRLAGKIKKHFPRLPVCILADGLYPNNSVFGICHKNKWGFIITLKDGNLKTFQCEVGLLKTTATKREVYRADKTSRTTLEYKFLNDIEYGKHYYSWIECNEFKVNINKEKSTLTSGLCILLIFHKQPQMSWLRPTPDACDGKLKTKGLMPKRTWATIWNTNSQGFHTRQCKIIIAYAKLHMP